MHASSVRVTSVISFLLLTAYASSIIDETIPLSKSFEVKSELITYKEPFWKIGSSSFNQELRNYSVANTKVRWKKTDEKLTDREIETNFINYLLFDDELAYITEKYDIEDSQRYSFDLIQDEKFVSNSKCEVFAHSLGEKITAGDSYFDDDVESSSIQNREDTFVFCIIEHKDKTWELSLSALRDEPLDVQLGFENEFYEIIDVSEQILIKEGKDGVEKVKAPTWLAGNSSLEIYQHNNKVSALSFVGKPKMWLQQDLADEQKELLLTVNYSLSMFNWLDDEWRAQSGW